MMNKKTILSWLLAMLPLIVFAQFGTLSPLHVEGNQLQDEQGNHVVLHGVMDTPSPYFNNNRWGTSASVAYTSKCIDYFNQLYSAVTDTKNGAYCNVFRLHLDPCWCFVNGKDESDYGAFKESRFKQFWEKLYRPLILKALEHGLYVVVRPPGVCPNPIQVGGGYQDYLKTVWGLVSSDAEIQKYAGYVSLELANEPVDIYDASGKQDNAGNAPHDFFQPIVDLIRSNGFTGIIWVPGAGYQSIYTGYEKQPITGYNIGYAVHNYPGWYGGSDKMYDADTYIKNFENMVPVVKTSPVIITEIDWSPENPNGEGKYNEFGEWVPANYGTWGTASTSKWASAYKALIDKYDISMTLTGTADYLDIDEYIKNGRVVPAFQGVAEACGEACMQWYKEYANKDFAYKAFEKVRYSDQGDGTYINPIINADFPDSDVIRVNDTYYLLSTTMFHLPGATLLQSKDLVNWEYCSNPLESLSDVDKFNLANGQSAYAGGMWASALGYVDGKFYILLQANDAGMYVMTATDPSGKWTSRKLNDGYYDCGMLIEGNDIYVVSGINHITVSRLDRNFNKQESREIIVRDDSGLEGNKIYHIGDYYYIYSTYGGTEGSQTIFRSKTPMGNYEEVSDRVIKNQHIHQGALVDTPSGEWWTILFKDDGAIGRVPFLEPVKWQDGWPVIGNNGVDVSKGATAYPKPNVGKSYPRTTLPTNDTFTALSLGKQWQWNHQPDNSAWSLADNPGSLRLYTIGKAQNLKEARNSLTQRMIALHDEGDMNSKKPMVYGMVKLNIANMAEGDVAGLAVFQDPYSWIGVKMINGARHLYVYREAYDSKAVVDQDCGEITSDVVYLQARANFGTSRVNYYYSTDNVEYTRAGNQSFEMRYAISIFVGQRFYLFNYATKQNGGYVDFDWFSTEQNFTEESYYSPEKLQTYSPEDLQFDRMEVPEKVAALNGGSVPLSIEAVMKSGRRQAISSLCEYAIDDEAITKIERGTVVGLKEGTVKVTATYTDAQGVKHAAVFTVCVETFPIAEGIFNPSIEGEGSFDASSRTFTTAANGQAGWEYPLGLDISDAAYLVVKFASKPSVSTKLCIYDASKSYTRTLTGATTKLKLANVTQVDKQSICRIAFQTAGGRPMTLSSVFLSDDGETPTGILNVTASVMETDEWFNLLGVKIKKPTTPGIYIHNGKKVIIR